jgi:two-component system chemotaxis response regulator CheB
MKKTRVLIVDDSAIVRKVLSDALAGEPDLEVVGTAPDPFVARDKILSLQPDVLTLDIEMPRMDGITFLRKLMHFRPMPVVVISSLAQTSCRAALEALECGAVEVLAKPNGPYSVGELRTSLAAKLRAAAVAKVRFKAGPTVDGDSMGMSTPPRTIPVVRVAAPPKMIVPVSAASVGAVLIAIGASTGGTEAIAAVLTRLPKDSPPILIAQHIPPVFSRAFANRLNEICAISVKEAEDGDAVCPGLALIAPGDFHMVLRRNGTRYAVSVKTGPRVCYQRPSVDVLFQSVAEVAAAKAVGVLLTGMGSDGAQGMLKMRQAGANTIAQDEATCVVFGMPREAIRLNGAAQVLPLPKIAQAMLMTRTSRN